MGWRLGGALVVAVLLSGCGDDGAGSGSSDPYGYLPADAGAVARVDVDLDGEPVRALEEALRPRVLQDARLEQVAAELLGAPNWDAIDVLVGDELVVGAPGVAPLALGSRGPEDNAFVGAIGLDDEESMRGALERVGYEKSGKERGADVYEGAGPPIAIDDGTLVFANTRAALAQALRVHDGPEGGRFTRAQLERTTEGLPRDAPVRVHVNLARLSGQPELRGMRKVKWVDALRTGALAVSASADAVVVDAAANTEAAALRDGDLPFPPGAPATEVPTRRDTINSGSADQSQTTTFLLDVLRAWRPTGRFAEDVATVERERGIDFDEEVLRQFDGPSSSALAADGSFGARSTVRDPKRMERTLRQVAPDVPRLAQDLDPLRAEGLALLLLFAPDAPVGTSVLGDSDVNVERIDGERALYRMGNLDRDPSGGGQTGVGPDEIVFGLIGDAFVVASDEGQAHAAARQQTAPVPGARGASVMRWRANGPLRGLAERALGVDPGPRAEMTGSVQASRERLRARARLRMP